MIKKTIFRPNGLLGLRAIVFVIISLTLMTLDHQWQAFKPIKSWLTVTVLPVRYLVDWPIQLLGSTRTHFINRQQLLEENAKLRADQILLRAKLEKLVTLERENAQLRELLSSTSRINGKVTVAHLLASQLAPFLQKIVINKGRKHGVYVGQPVIDAYGVMGQVVAAGAFASEVLLITDTRSAIPVQDNRNGVRAIAEGLGDNDKLAIIHIPDTVDIREGDLFVTSGLAGRFPEGYPVGKVNLVQKLPGQRFAKITLMPSAHINRSRQLLLVWPNHKAKQQKTGKQHG